MKLAGKLDVDANAKLIQPFLGEPSSLVCSTPWRCAEKCKAIAKQGIGVIRVILVERSYRAFSDSEAHGIKAGQFKLSGNVSCT